MARAGAGWFVVVSIGVALAGCMGGGSADGVAESAASAETALDAASGSGTIFRFPGFNGTFAGAMETSDTFAGGPTNYVGTSPDPHRHKIPDVAVDVWTHVRAEVSYRTAPPFNGFLQSSLVLDDGQYRPTMLYANNQEGVAIFEGAFRINSGSAYLEVRSLFFHRDDIEYELHASWRGDPTIIYPFDAVELSLTPGTDLVIETVRFDEGRYSEPLTGRLLLFDGADSLVTRHEANAGRSTVSIPAEAAEGRFVYVPAGGAPVRLSTTTAQEDQTLRLLSLNYEDGPAVEVTPPGTTTWRFSLPNDVVSVGFYAEYADLFVQSGVEGRLRIESPKGPLREWQFGCSAPSLCYGLSSNARMDFTVDALDGNIVPGDYKYELDPGTSTIVSAGAMIRTYVR